MLIVGFNMVVGISILVIVLIGLLRIGIFLMVFFVMWIVKMFLIMNRLRCLFLLRVICFSIFFVIFLKYWYVISELSEREGLYFIVFCMLFWVMGCNISFIVFVFKLLEIFCKENEIY